MPPPPPTALTGVNWQANAPSGDAPLPNRPRLPRSTDHARDRARAYARGSQAARMRRARLLRYSISPFSASRQEAAVEDSAGRRLPRQFERLGEHRDALGHPLVVDVAQAQL